MNINQRISMLINSLYKGSQKAFCDATKIPISTVNNIVNEGNGNKKQTNPAFNQIAAVAKIHKDKINLEWLILGEGPAFKISGDFSENTENGISGTDSEPQDSVAEEPAHRYGNCKDCPVARTLLAETDYWKSRLNYLDLSNKLKDEQIGMLDGTVKKLMTLSK